MILYASNSDLNKMRRAAFCNIRWQQSSGPNHNRYINSHILYNLSQCVVSRLCYVHNKFWNMKCSFVHIPTLIFPFCQSHHCFTISSVCIHITQYQYFIFNSISLSILLSQVPLQHTHLLHNSPAPLVSYKI